MTIGRYIISILAIIAFLVLQLYLIRFFTVNMPFEHVPWCGPISKVDYLGQFIRYLLVICVTLDGLSVWPFEEAILLFILQGFMIFYKILFTPLFIKDVDFVVKTKEFGVCLVFIIGILCKLFSDTMNFDIIYFIISLPLLNYAWVNVERFRRRAIIRKIRFKELKIESEYEYAMQVLMQLVSSSQEVQSNTNKSRVAFGTLITMASTHAEDCEDVQCIC